MRDKNRKFIGLFEGAHLKEKHKSFFFFFLAQSPDLHFVPLTAREQQVGIEKGAEEMSP